ncbi:hypothetical protein C2S51_037979 [Perilla frutescens var. frutescens]|nr:hypothetical protein C2S51_037979 [Perilla frutescens var. frutescens]
MGREGGRLAAKRERGCALGLLARRNAHGQCTGGRAGGRTGACTVSLSLSEIGATASVLLGFAPPSTLTAANSVILHPGWVDLIYVEDASRSLNGELLIPIANGAFMRLHVGGSCNFKFFIG